MVLVNTDDHQKHTKIVELRGGDGCMVAMDAI